MSAKMMTYEEWESLPADYSNRDVTDPYALYWEPGVGTVWGPVRIRPEDADSAEE